MLLRSASGPRLHGRLSSNVRPQSKRTRAMPLIAATRLRIRSVWLLPVFFIQAMRSSNQAKAADGNLALAILNDARRTFWTCSAWTSKDQMHMYMTSGAHKGVMRKLARWCDEASVVHWEQANSELPSWQEVHRRMQEEGRASRVERPTDAHTAFSITPPNLGKARPVRLK